MGLAALNMVSCLIFPYEITLCINNNDNHMTFVGHIVCLCPLSSFAPSLRSGANLGHKWTICPTQVMWLSYYDPPNTKDGKMARFGLRTASSLRFGEWGFAVSFYSVQDCRLLLWMFGMETKKLRLPTFRNSLQMLVISGKYKKRGTKQERKL